MEKQKIHRFLPQDCIRFIHNLFLKNFPYFSEKKRFSTEIFPSTMTSLLIYNKLNTIINI